MSALLKEKHEVMPSQSTYGYGYNRQKSSLEVALDRVSFGTLAKHYGVDGAKANAVKQAIKYILSEISEADDLAMLRLQEAGYEEGLAKAIVS
ncbi:hypothetical protein SAMN04488518_11790 [Pseudovibrio ascidiaceicola]|uniref:Uncharacterized protein n=1 Tax=Pseudovibrio ascidiaceicola TaxID=285279 RepID=A0A1I4F4Q4_9HYPH|nr:hypothetical protein [Pseudovibrio ascidiaceicola]SFL12962.1 hypothetical protein SAMN04488518_11790 [Pseudovibrio ascidiaceicola]